MPKTGQDWLYFLGLLGAIGGSGYLALLFMHKVVLKDPGEKK